MSFKYENNKRAIDFFYLETSLGHTFRAKYLTKQAHTTTGTQKK